MLQRKKCQWNVVCGMGQRKDKCWICLEGSHCHVVIITNQHKLSAVCELNTNVLLAALSSFHKPNSLKLTVYSQMELGIPAQNGSFICLYKFES
jgi:hypothetical protein